MALFGENGPCKVNADGTDTILNEFSWNRNANLIYIDQPAGTGFSYGSGFDHNEKQVADDMYDFLQQFFKAHPEYLNNDFFAVCSSSFLFDLPRPTKGRFLVKLSMLVIGWRVVRRALYPSSNA